MIDPLQKRSTPKVDLPLLTEPKLEHRILTKRMRFRRARVMPAHFTETLPPAVAAPATPGVVSGVLGWEFPDRRRSEAATLRDLHDSEQVQARAFLFGSKDGRGDAALALRDIRNSMLLERLRLEGRP